MATGAVVSFTEPVNPLGFAFMVTEMAMDEIRNKLYMIQWSYGTYFGLWVLDVGAGTWSWLDLEPAGCYYPQHIAVSEPENKLFVKCIGISGQPNPGIYVRDFDTGASAFIGDDDYGYMDINESTGQLFTGIEVGQNVAVVGVASNTLYNVPVEQLGGGAQWVQVRKSTNHAFVDGMQAVAIVDGASRTRTFTPVPYLDMGGIVIQDVEVNQDTGWVYAIPDARLPYVTVILDPPAGPLEPPAPPRLSSPGNGTHTNDSTPTLAWSASEGAVGYLLQWQGGVSDVGNVTAYTVSAQADGTYTWTVAAYNTLGMTSAFTTAWSLTIDTPPSPPRLLTPANGTVLSDTTPTLTWAASAGAAGYRVNWNGAVNDVGNVAQWTTPLLADGTYTWTVAAYDALHNTSAYTDVWSLSIDRAPEVHTVTPIAGATDIVLAAPVVIAFSEPINPGTLGYTATPDPGNWAAVWNTASTIVTLSHAAYAYRTTYTVTLNQARDMSGNSLSGAPYVWQFTSVPARVYLPILVR